MKIKQVVRELACSIFLLALFSGSALAVQPPLITDEANTIGKYKAEVELNGEYAHDSHEGVTAKETVIESKLTYGTKRLYEVTAHLKNDKADRR